MAASYSYYINFDCGIKYKQYNMIVAIVTSNAVAMFLSINYPQRYDGSQSERQLLLLLVSSEIRLAWMSTSCHVSLS